MKKIILLLILSMAMFSLASSKVYGNSEREITNILDLTNFAFDYDTGKFNTRVPINVELGEEYSINIDKEFLGSLNNEITVKMNGVSHDLTMDDYGDFYFVSFLTTSTKLDIVNFAYEGLVNTHMMLYKGDDSDFEDVYIPYNSEINFVEGELIVDYDQPLTVKTINSYIASEHPRLKSPVDVIVNRNDYVNKVGSHKAVYYSVINNITNTFILTIRVVDYTPPLIETSELSYPFNSRPTIAELLDDIIITDNADIINSSDIVVTKDQYTTATNIGEYDVDILVKDKSGNESAKTIAVKLISQSVPEIIGPNAIFVYTTKDVLTESDILATMRYKDEFDSDVLITRKIITNDYNETKEPGKYTVVIEAENSIGNKITKTIVIHVIGNEQSTFLYDIKITATTSYMVTEQEIIKIFSDQTTSNTVDLNSVKVNKDAYDLNYDKAGTYKAYIEYEDDNIIKYAEVLIVVSGKDFDKRLLLLGIPSLLVVAIPIFIIKRKKR